VKLGRVRDFRTHLSAKPHVKASDSPGLVGRDKWKTALDGTADGYGTLPLRSVPAAGRNHDRGMMETLAAIVVAAVTVPLVLLGIILVEVLTGFILSFL
jgi:hypothetical protein